MLNLWMLSQRLPPSSDRRVSGGPAVELEVSTLTESQWALILGLEFGRQVIWRLACDRVGVVKLIGGIELAVAVYSDCLGIGL